jgi:hypothetical protein
MSSFIKTSWKGLGHGMNFLGRPIILNRYVLSVFKGIDLPFGGGVESILVQSVFVNWRLGIFFFILNGLHHKISKKLLYAA